MYAVKGYVLVEQAEVYRVMQSVIEDEPWIERYMSRYALIKN